MSSEMKHIRLKIPGESFWATQYPDLPGTGGYMSTDFELLKYAALAVGISHDGFDEGCGYDVWWLPDLCRYDAWNPLTNDGDALRLAVKLSLQVAFGTYNADKFEAYSPRGADVEEWFSASTGEYAAARRAIVQAAAEIGRGIVQRGDHRLPEDNYCKTQTEAEEIGRQMTSD